MTIGGQSTRQFRRWEFACTAEEPIITRLWRKPSDVVLQGFAVAGVDRTKSQPNVRVPFHPPREELPSDLGTERLRSRAHEVWAPEDGHVDARRPWARCAMRAGCVWRLTGRYCGGLQSEPSAFSI